ncbi:uncharacterized protein G2W53_007053 [Senna tora]|uniref:Uncharacterized protein n=1 Tax=Senna tora TaxID=362788 RepID=A0A835CD59_9FABA|nr:uncharacterized protein G2W53_007053 [Senna tora]
MKKVAAAVVGLEGKSTKEGFKKEIMEHFYPMQQGDKYEALVYSIQDPTQISNPIHLHKGALSTNAELHKNSSTASMTVSNKAQKGSQKLTDAKKTSRELGFTTVNTMKLKEKIQGQEVLVWGYPQFYFKRTCEETEDSTNSNKEIQSHSGDGHKVRDHHYIFINFLFLEWHGCGPWHGIIIATLWRNEDKLEKSYHDIQSRGSTNMFKPTLRTSLVSHKAILRSVPKEKQGLFAELRALEKHQGTGEGPKLQQKEYSVEVHKLLDEFASLFHRLSCEKCLMVEIFKSLEDLGLVRCEHWFGSFLSKVTLCPFFLSL